MINKVTKIKAKIAILQQEIIKLQTECTHQDVVGYYDSNTGNWCPQDDSYWLHLECPSCNKVWNIESTEDDYRTITFKKKDIKL